LEEELKVVGNNMKSLELSEQEVQQPPDAAETSSHSSDGSISAFWYRDNIDICDPKISAISIFVDILYCGVEICENGFLHSQFPPISDSHYRLVAAHFNYQFPSTFQIKFLFTPVKIPAHHNW